MTMLKTPATNAETQQASLRPTRRLALAGLCVLLAGCTVQPLYQAPTEAAHAGPATLARVAVDDAPDRVTQQVRNQLLFLLRRGAAGDAQPDYQAELNVTSGAQDVFRVESPDGSTNVTSRRITLNGTLTLTAIADGTVLVRQTRSANASFENTRQEFANLRALRDAENRAASELAEQFRIVIVAALADK